MSELTTNKFIQSLIIGERTDSYTRQNVTYYKLPIDLMNIKTDSDQRQLNIFLEAFNKLKKFTYNRTPVTDLFAYYNIIVNQNKYGSDRLTSVFRNFVKDPTNDSILKSYYKYVGESDYYLRELDSMFDLDDVRRKVAPIVSNSNL